MKQYQITAENLPLVAHVMPEQFNEFQTLIGTEAALALVNQCAGRNFRIGRNITPQGKALFENLVAVVGDKAAEKITSTLAKYTRALYVPTCSKAKQELRNIDIKQQFDEYISPPENMSAPKAVAKIAAHFGLTDRQICYILKNA